MKYVFLVILILAAVALSACHDVNNVSLLEDPVISEMLDTQDEAQYTIGLVMKTPTNPFFVEMEKGARKAEEELGIKLVVRTGAKETSIDQQIQIVEDLISAGVDGIVIAPGSSTELVPVLKKAQDEGIRIVNVDNRLDAETCSDDGLTGVPFISVRNDEGAYLSVKEITRGIVEKTDALIFEGIEEAENSKLRVEGAKKAFNETPSIEIKAIESANWKIDEANTLAKELFKQYPNVKLVFCANDMMALGVVQYLREMNRQDVLVAGFDNLSDTQTAIADGWVTATIDQQASQQGYLGVKTVVNMLSNVHVNLETYVTAQVITNENFK